MCLPNLGNDHIVTESLEANLTRLIIAWSHELQKQYFQIKKHDWGLHKILRYLKKLRWKIHLLSSKSWQIKRKNSLTPNSEQTLSSFYQIEKMLGLKEKLKCKIQYYDDISKNKFK